MVQQRLPNEHHLGCFSYRLKTNGSQHPVWVTGPQEMPKPNISSINLQCRKFNLLFTSTGATWDSLYEYQWLRQLCFSLSWKQVRRATRAIPDVKRTHHISQIRGFLFKTIYRSLERALGIMLLKIREGHFIFATNWRHYSAFFATFVLQKGSSSEHL